MYLEDDKIIEEGVCFEKYGTFVFRMFVHVLISSKNFEKKMLKNPAYAAQNVCVSLSVFFETLGKAREANKCILSVVEEQKLFRVRTDSPSQCRRDVILANFVSFYPT